MIEAGEERLFDRGLHDVDAGGIRQDDGGSSEPASGHSSPEAAGIPKLRGGLHDEIQFRDRNLEKVAKGGVPLEHHRAEAGEIAASEHPDRSFDPSDLVDDVTGSTAIDDIHVDRVEHLDAGISQGTSEGRDHPFAGRSAIGVATVGESMRDSAVDQQERELIVARKRYRFVLQRPAVDAKRGIGFGCGGDQHVHDSTWRPDELVFGLLGVPGEPQWIIGVCTGMDGPGGAGGDFDRRAGGDAGPGGNLAGDQDRPRPVGSSARGDHAEQVVGETLLRDIDRIPRWGTVPGGFDPQVGSGDRRPAVVRGGDGDRGSSIDRHGKNHAVQVVDVLADEIDPTRGVGDDRHGSEAFLEKSSGFTRDSRIGFRVVWSRSHVWVRYLRKTPASLTSGDSMRGLVIFDVDGTLSLTSEVDDDCWRDAAREVLGVTSMSTDWSTYSHSTDEAIATDLIRRGTDRISVDDLVHRVRDVFADGIRESLGRDPGLFRPVPGSPGVFKALTDQGWSVAIATGGWRVTAEMKLAAAGVPFSGVPAAHADDAHPREEIISIAARRAMAEVSHRIPTVYVGDGIWDVKAAARLGIGFVGIGEAASADRLRGAGAEVVLADFSDPSSFLAEVEARGTVPHGDPQNRGPGVPPTRS